MYFGHHRCASTWIKEIIQVTCKELELSFHSEDRYGVLPKSLDAIDFFAHVNANASLVASLDHKPYKAFHVIRDPRDILISSYFSDRYSHFVYSEEFARFREQLNSLDFDEGLRLELERREQEIEAFASWDYHNPSVYETRFEVLTAHPQEEFLRIFDFLDFPISREGIAALGATIQIVSKKTAGRLGVRFHPRTLPTWWLGRIIRKNSFQNLAGRKKGEEDPQHHYRKGVQGDWANYLEGENKILVKERLGQLLIDLGYEKDFNW